MLSLLEELAGARVPETALLVSVGLAEVPEVIAQTFWAKTPEAV